MESDTLNPPPAGRGWLVLAFEFVGVAAFVVMFGSTLLSVIARYFEFGGVEWSFEIAGIAFIWITFIGVINAELRGENVAFEALNHSAPARLRGVFDILGTIALLAIGIAFMVSGWAVWQRSWAVPTSVLRMPTGVITITVLILGVSAICIAASRVPRVLGLQFSAAGKGEAQ
ncbi:TRAP transporter small permease subunit [Mesorhizobium sp. LNJC391B00]|uniref:TRAP transporter small permease n=1 Tax=Mesorhizobium sp. LNJC391B00 TaxID=1287273 RepID=UPI0003CF6468|nr:TRAP transporter small permease subunit [Mesorhizobium sp. LNJC391B00]ESY32180.1 C4-dicarboxylate ABC transporter [Mesorhizobium sp. LNJC391B00]